MSGRKEHYIQQFSYCTKPSGSKKYSMFDLCKAPPPAVPGVSKHKTRKNDMEATWKKSVDKKWCSS
jgi:hypothetical protein